MDVLTVVVLVVVFALSTWMKSHRRAARSDWRMAAEQLGLTLVEPLRLRGERAGVAIEACEMSIGPHDSPGTYVVCRVRKPLRVRVARERGRLMGGNDEPIGDPSFDAQVLLRGDPAELIAALGASERAAVRDAVAQGWTYDRGVWAGHAHGVEQDVVLRTIEQGLALAAIMTHPRGDLPARLATRVEADPEPEVRRRALALLLEHHAESEPARDAIRAALADADPHVRLSAARAARDPGALRDLATTAEPPIVAAALDALHDQDGASPEAHAAVRHLAARLPAVATPVRYAIARALVNIAVPEREAILLGLLADDDSFTQVAAVQTLARVGTIAAVPALVPLRDRLVRGPLGDAARDAILAIQARVGDLDAGRLALVPEHADGGLALVPDDTREVP